MMSHVLPPNFFQGDDVASRFKDQLPIICWSTLEDPPFDISFFLLCPFRPNVFRFFYEMISLWLIPGKRTNAILQFAADFSMPDLSSQKYIAGEVMLHIEHPGELKILQKNLPVIESEIRLGVKSTYQADRTLEIKGLTSNEKIALIQENIVSLIQRRPQDFDYDILSEMQHFIVLSRDDFKEARTFRHMSKIICVHYLFRKALRHSLEAFPDRRYISVKLIRAEVASKRILGIALGISFLQENEILEASHILSAVKSIVPGAKKVNGSFFKNQSRSNLICTLYLEIEKENPITLEEERRLKLELPSELKNHIQCPLHSLFMPQNEEEIMRHILSLSGQLTLVRDLPQTMILFNQQTADSLEFLVIVLRLLKPELKPIIQAFDLKPTFLEFIHDRTKIVGSLRKKYKKEATVFRLKIRKTPFLRSDYSVDLYKARHEVAKELRRVIGEFRDFNGGTISKERELFEKVRKELGHLAKEHAFLLENFFFSLTPAVMRSVLPSEPVKNIFTMFVEAENEGLTDNLPFQIRIRETGGYFHLHLSAKNPSFYEILAPAIEAVKVSTLQITSCFLPQSDAPSSFAMICRNTPDQEEVHRLRLAIERAMTNWAQRFLSLI